MKLFSDLRTIYGQDCVKVVRNWEKSEKKLSRYRNHLVFSLRCKEENVIPKSLNIACPIKTAKGRDIIHRAKQALLRERINVISGKIDHLKDSATSAKTKARETLSGSNEYLGQVTQFVEISREKAFQNSKWRQKEKLNKLIDKKVNREEKRLDLSAPWLKKWIVNLSKYKLNKDETSVLQKGLGFAVTPDKIPIEDFVVATELATKMVTYDDAPILRSRITGILRNAQLPEANLSKGEQLALKNLAQNKDLTILPADKGKSTVIMDTDSYKSKVNDMLKDDKTYEVLPRYLNVSSLLYLDHC